MEASKVEASRELAATLLKIIWRGIPADYKSRYRMTIWDQFENEIRSACRTSNLAKFISSICSRLQVSLGRTENERAVVEDILRTADDQQMLKLLREETTLLVLMVHVDNEEKRNEWIERQREME
jgi:hypothetical protein